MNEAKDSPKRQDKLRKHINGIYTRNNIGSADESKQKKTL
jgi:hypothetical protein